MLRLFTRLFKTNTEALPPSHDKEIAKADPDLAQFSGFDSYTPNPSDLVGTKGLAIFERMRKDDQVKACLSFKKRSILSSEWSVVSPDDAPEDWEVTRFVEWVLREINGSFVDDLKEILTALDYGYSITEKLYQEVTAGDWAGKVTLRELKTRHPNGFNFDVDEYGNIKSLVQSDTFGKRVELPISKFIIYSYDSEFSNPYGVSDLEAAFRPWWSKDNAYKWLAMFLERYGIPPALLYYNPDLYNATSQSTLKTILKRFQAGTVAILPRREPGDAELFTPELGANVEQVFMPAITMYDNHISRALLVPNLVGMTSDGENGSLARSKTHFNSFMLVVEAVRDNDIAERVVNDQIIKQLCDINYPGLKSYPKFRFAQLPDESRFQLMESWSKLLTSGAVTKSEDDEDHIRATLKFPEKSETDLPHPPGTPPGPPSGDSSFRVFSTPNGGRYALTRKATTPEKRINFTKLTDDLDAHEAKAHRELAEALLLVRDQVKKTVKSRYEKDPFEVVKDLKVGRSSMLNAAIRSLTYGAYQIGREHVSTELSGFSTYAAPAGVAAKQAEKYLKAKDFWVKGLIDDGLLRKLQAAILQGIRNGDGTGDVIARLDVIFEEYVKRTGEAAIAGQPLVPKTALLETIVRTNTTDSYNQGRLVRIREVGEDLIPGVMYSAILDERTTPVCSGLDGKIFRTGSRDLDTLAPPNHHNCRSMLVAVVLDEAPDSGDYITSRQVGRAKEQAGKGFV